MIEANSSLGYRDVQEILALSSTNTTAAAAEDQWSVNDADHWNGGDGIDTAVFSGPKSNYTGSYLEDGVTLQLTDTVGNDGTDLLRDTEVLRFSDGDVMVPAPAAASAAMAGQGASLFSIESDTAFG